MSLEIDMRRSVHLTFSRLVNAFAFWQAQDISNATATYFDDIMQATAHIQSVAGSVDAVHVMNGETGWPGGESLACIQSSRN